MKRISIIFIAISFVINSFGQIANQIEKKYQDYFTKNISKLDPIDGIWSCSVTINTYYNNVLTSNQIYPQDCKFIIREGKSIFDSLIIGTSRKIIPAWNKFEKTASIGYYLYTGFYLGYSEENSKKVSTIKANAIITSKGILKYSYDVPESVVKGILGNNYRKGGDKCKVEVEMIKVFPLASDIVKATPSTGTGFAISSNGYIATCNHVIDGATTIRVKGVAGDFSKSYPVKVISTDVNNDLAIIKIDTTFTTLGTIPYTIKATSSDVGSRIFILGYPLTATMGDEIKLTDGLISAKSGCLGDITLYQISAAAQPGNSGGPLFDKSGNLIGIVNAKHVEAENATYAVKSSYLNILIDALPTAITTPTVNCLTAKVLTEQVKLIKNFVYIIEVK